ncbi:MAG: HNH endonuclease, partial [Candidatus Thiodiazotropha weberae]|nr:HNH endonuclease [Candidatus Thiodiazotropha lotti]MCW4212742.1 HNH endonuclease [Candidatus Thiodiazotropha lotti]
MGEQAHIAPHGSGGPRRISEVPEGERDTYDNIILLCPNHHRGPVDGQPNTYTEQLLHQWKNDHEEWVKDTLTQAIPRLQFDELQVVAERLAEAEPTESTPLVNVNIPAKMKANDLTAATRGVLVMAVAGAKEAQRYINFTEPTKPKFGRKLRSTFMAQYHQGVANGLESDDLFWHLYYFAAGPLL